MTDAPPVKTTVTIAVDGRSIEAKPGELVIAAAERNGIYIPRFCYHNRMDPVGMCRMCVVDIDTGRGPALQPACMIPVAEGMKVHTQTPGPKKAQEGVLEFLLINHPLDCPVCDKGGECPLQDQTMSHGPGESRFVEEKRHYAKPIAISDLVYLDRERCILCDRCTRFARDVAGDPLIHFMDRGSQTQVLTFPNHPFASYFSGNTVQICPVGALLSRPYRFKARPWDLEQLESTCTTCAVGCRITVQSSRNELVRYSGVDSDPVNWSWLCDRGRFNHQSIGSQHRLTVPVVKDGDREVEVSWSIALDRAAALLDNARQTSPSSIAVLGGARGTNEDAYAWAKLAKSVLGTDNVDAQLGDGLEPELILSLPRATIDEVCAADTIVLLGPDLKEELPVLFLRIRDAITRGNKHVIELSPRATALSKLASASLRYRPGEAAAAVALVTGTAASTDAAVLRARELLGAGTVAVVVGRPSLAESAVFMADAALALLRALPNARFLSALRRGNVHGAIDMGMTPGLLPGRVPLGTEGVWESAPIERGLDAAGILQAAAAGRIGCLVLLGADPLSDFPDRDLALRALGGAGSIIAVDCFATESNERADVVLPAAAFAEKSGTTTNIEGRVSVLSQKVTPPGTARADWMIASELALRLGGDLGFTTVSSVTDEIAARAPSHRGLTATELAKRANADGVVAGAKWLEPLTREATAAPTVDGYSLRLIVSRRLYDKAIMTTMSPALAPLMPGARVHLSPYDFDRLGGQRGRAVRVSAARTHLTVDAVPDEAVPRGSAWLAFNQQNVTAAELVDASLPVNDVRVENL